VPPAGRGSCTPQRVELAEGGRDRAAGHRLRVDAAFFEAAAVVIDVGGGDVAPPIAAREVGIPCVVNVKTAPSTSRRANGSPVDGGAGTVQLH